MFRPQPIRHLLWWDWSIGECVVVMTVSMRPLYVAHIHVHIHVRMRLLDIVVWFYVCNGWFCSGGCSV